MEYTISELPRLAFGFALCAHRKQKRKYTGEPYIVHCEAVMRLVEDSTDNEYMIAASCLHDVLEDTDVTKSEMRAVFGNRVTDLVGEVTDVSRPKDGNRAVRKAIDLKHLSGSSWGGATIKLSDIIDNTSNIVKYDKKFAQIYLRENKALLDVLRHGHHGLWERANSTIQDAIREMVQQTDVKVVT